ncbi:MAG: molybdate ABC transporter permease subunit [Planctomycetota bacterium]
MIDWTPLFLTFKLASVTTGILCCIGIPLAYWLAYTRFKFKFLVEALVSMPLVLPPSVLGFYLLVFFGPASFSGKFLQDYFNLQLVFSFEGLLVASILYSLPFMVHPIQSGFESLPISLKEASYTLGKSKTETLLKVLLPNIKPALLSGIILSFAHTIGEFGVVLMIGGSIQGETKVASIAIYEKVEALDYKTANIYSLILFLLSFCILIFVHFANKRLSKAV